jgi:arginine-tRNA-protein transferase
MKVFFSENNVDYTTYTFSYSIYAVREGLENLEPIYEQGFLPYTGDLSIEKEVFYGARSLRVNLADFSDTSENRRVGRLIEPLGVQLEVIEKEKFDLDDSDFNSFCSEYIKERIGDDNMSQERWNYILSKPLGSHIFRFYTSEKTIGYVLCAINETLLHYWFAFFDTEYMKSHSLGKYMMWSLINWAKQHGKSYAYLGTAYKPAALYKIRDHRGLEFWDGQKWNNDSKILKAWCQNDLIPLPSDRFKVLENKSEFLNNL